jgi:hypothetical protein
MVGLYQVIYSFAILEFLNTDFSSVDILEFYVLPFWAQTEKGNAPPQTPGGLLHKRKKPEILKNPEPPLVVL